MGDDRLPANDADPVGGAADLARDVILLADDRGAYAEVGALPEPGQAGTDGDLGGAGSGCAREEKDGYQSLQEDILLSSSHGTFFQLPFWFNPALREAYQ